MREFVRYVFVPAIVGGLVGLAVMFAMSVDTGSSRPGYSAAVKQASPSVVNIYSSKYVTPPICQLPSFRDWCSRFSTPGSGRMKSSLGSGVIVHEDGYILTNRHVIAGADEILVGFANGQATTASLIGSDPGTDLAVIRVQATGLTPISVGSSDDVEVGDLALAIGNPFGIGQTVSSGIISAKGRAGVSPSPYDDFIQTDAAINPGNSGGALIDTEGKLIGINSMIVSRSGGSDGIGFAIPARLAMSVLNEIIENGRVIRGYLGVVVANIPPAGAGVGLEIMGVLPNGPADIAGLRVGDYLLAINEHPAVSSTVVTRQISHALPGTNIELDVMRRGRQFSLTAESGIRPVLRN
ncbi:MAG: trypsin-like peptidase domain-containing protein [Gammaproteobacteria bacterium]|nr:trypsin-like peptidase domain-containing protein [Gammaproteobacteria bacterium]